MTKLFLKIALLVSILIGCTNPSTIVEKTTENEVRIDNSMTSTDFREESIYFLLPTRFYDGDSTNNVPNEWCSYDPTNPSRQITDPNDVTWRGDFKGLITKGLDYIKDLGFTAVWLTPIVMNRGPLDYHGYHAWDFTKVDPRLESPGYTYQDFINAAHAKGIKVIQDVVWNHSGRFGIYQFAEIKYNTDPTQPWGKDKFGVPLKDNPNWRYDGFTKNPDDNKIWSRANLAKMPSPYNSNLALYNWPSTQSFVDTTSINWFHHSGNGFAQGWDDTENLYNRALAGDCPDLNTGSVDVRNYLVNAYKKYIDMGVDAFRVDTVKHMSKADVQYFVDAFKAYKPTLFIFGEVAQKRHELHTVEEINPHWYTWRGATGASANSGMAVLDFYAQATMHNAIEYSGGARGLGDCARYDHLYSDPSTNIMWLDNHDFGPNNDWNRRYGGSDIGLATYVNFTWTWRGIPSMYYGSEIRFKAGAYADIHEAADIERSLERTGRAYYGDNILTASSHKLYQHTKKMNLIRKAVVPLQKGTWSWNGNPSGDGIGYTRTFNNQTVAVGVAMNGNAFFSFNGLPSGTYVDAVTGKSVSVSNGNLNFTVNGGSAAVFVQNGTGRIGNLGTGYFQSSSDAYTNGGTTTTTTVNNTSWSAAYFRGTPNGWATTAMTKTGTYTFETTQTFSGVANPRFKIDRYANWVESYPTADYVVADNKTYKIVFNTSTKAFTVTPITTTTTTTSTTTTTTINTTSLKVHIYKNTHTNWSSFYCYFWGANGSIAANQWPGDLMTSEGNGWYLYTINSASSSSVIFNNGSGNQTIDLSRTTEGWFLPTGLSNGKVTGTWYNSKPNTTTTTSTTTTSTTTTTIPSGSITLKMTKDVGSGYSIFFTGSVSALTNWGTGIQGTWTTGNVWQVTIPNPGNFQWKVRKGTTGGAGDIWESGNNHDQNNLWPAFNGGF